MGLDMYLSAKRYLWTHNEKDADLSSKINEAIGVKPIYEDQNDRFRGCSLQASEITLQAMYWRKANAIHNFFVEKIQDGEDDCKEYYVPRERLKELMELCKDILENPDAERDEDLEPCDGFFFGSGDKDEWYYKDLENTVSGLDDALKLPEEFEFYYRASW